MKNQLPVGAELQIHSYEVTTQGVDIVAFCPNPGPGEPSFWTACLDWGEFDEIKLLATTEERLEYLRVRFKRQFQGEGIKDYLDALIGLVIYI